MTRVFIDRTTGRQERILESPRLGERRRVIDRNSVENRARINTRKALDHMQVLPRSSEPGLFRKIRCVDYQCIAFPMANGIPHPLVHVRWEMRAPIHMDIANVMDH